MMWLRPVLAETGSFCRCLARIKSALEMNNIQIGHITSYKVQGGDSAAEFWRGTTPRSLPRDSRLVNMASGRRLHSSYGNYLWFLRRVRGADGAAVRIALGAAASVSFFPDLERILADLSSNVPFFRIWNLTTTIPFFLPPLIRVPGTVRET
jgi:hypothetical protein